MQQRIVTVVLLIGLAFALVALAGGVRTWRLPDREQGYTPRQQIDYSHRLHAGELQIDCRFLPHGRGQEPPCGDPLERCLHEVSPSL